MLLLGLDTATAVSAVAIVRTTSTADVEALAERSHLDPRRHGEVLPVQIDDVLRACRAIPTDLDAVAVGTGPGAFTGLRVGLATAQALGQALQIPVYGVSTLDILAFATSREQPFAIVTDARRREVFWASYDRYDVCTTTPSVGAPDIARAAFGDLPVIGPPGTPSIDGVAIAEGQHPSGLELCRLVVARLARGESLDGPAPLYLRRPDVTSPSRPKSVLS